MSAGDPKRLRLLASPGSRLGRGLATARDRGPSESELRALGSAVFGAPAAGIAATKAAASSLRLAGLTKAMAALAVAGTIVGTAGVAWHRRHRDPSTDAALFLPARASVAEEPRLGPEVIPLAAPAASQVPLSERPTARVERRRATLPPVAAPPRPAPTDKPSLAGARPPVTTDADEELRLVGAAQRALPRDPALALALAREHGRRFPDGALAQERDAVAVSALWQTGRRDEARDRAQRFLEEHPGSTYVGRMREILRQAEWPAP